MNARVMIRERKPIKWTWHKEMRTNRIYNNIQ